ncbi:MAG: hypothetical protein ACP5G0_05960 [Desulfomonilia bacterium]
MKRTNLINTAFSLVCALVLSCSADTDSSPGVWGDAQELTLRQRVSGAISFEGEVDWYYFHAVEANNVLQINCTSETLRSDVDLLVSVYELDARGDKALIYADHSPDGALAPADLTLNVYVEEPKDFYISVRDLLDDEFSEDSYYLMVDFSGNPEGNENFTQATHLEIGDGGCVSDAIGFVGDVDCYRFTSTGGVYDIEVEFSPFADTLVQLSASLYSANGTLIESRTSSGMRTYHMIHHLPAEEYYLQVHDYGRDHFDSASAYEVCVTVVDGVEGAQDDRMADALSLPSLMFDRSVPFAGSLDYVDDQDWYRIVVPESSSGFTVLHVLFSSQTPGEYQINILDPGALSLLCHTYRGGGDTYQTQVRLDGNEYYLMIQDPRSEGSPGGAPYEGMLTVLNIEDQAELQGDGNNTIETADVVIPTAFPAQATIGKIGYRSDVDWYACSIAPHDHPQVLEVFFDAPISQVEYAVSIFGDQLIKQLVSQRAQYEATCLMTGLLIAPNDEPEIYTIKVSDAQDDDGANIPYSLRVDLKDVPAALPPVAPGSPPEGSSIQYYQESGSMDASTITLEYNSVLRKVFAVNGSLLDMSNASLQTDTPEAGCTALTFPWIGGYIDYQGDQDWFMINFEPLEVYDDWYYDIIVDLYSPGGDVEYVWKFYPDRNDNAILADRSSGYDGFIASAGDLTITPEVVDSTTPSTGDDLFWLGDSWQGPAYFSISDFNYLFDQEGNERSEPDDDWGGYGSAPYYFRVRLVYHPGFSYPD